MACAAAIQESCGTVLVWTTSASVTEGCISILHRQSHGTTPTHYQQHTPYMLLSAGACTKRQDDSGCCTRSDSGTVRKTDGQSYLILRSSLCMYGWLRQRLSRPSSFPSCSVPLSRSATTRLSSVRWSTGSALCTPMRKGVGACRQRQTQHNRLLQHASVQLRHVCSLEGYLCRLWQARPGELQIETNPVSCADSWELLWYCGNGQ